MKRAKIIKNGHLNLERIESGNKPIPIDMNLKSVAEELAEKDKRIKELEKALKAVVKNFPEEVLKDQMNEDYNLITKALKK
jgi:hypothetical protein